MNRITCRCVLLVPAAAPLKKKPPPDIVQVHCMYVRRMYVLVTHTLRDDAWGVSVDFGPDLDCAETTCWLVMVMAMMNRTWGSVTGMMLASFQLETTPRVYELVT